MDNQNDLPVWSFYRELKIALGFGRLVFYIDEDNGSLVFTWYPDRAKMAWTGWSEHDLLDGFSEKGGPKGYAEYIAGGWRGNYRHQVEDELSKLSGAK